MTKFRTVRGAFTRLALSVSMGVTLVTATLTFAPVALASNCSPVDFPGGRACFQGFFTGHSVSAATSQKNVAPGSPAVPASVTASNLMAPFVSWIDGMYSSANVQDQTAARFIMSTMLGGAYEAGHTYDYAAWNDLMNNFDGSVNFINYNAPFPCGTVNTGYLTGPQVGNSTGDVDAWNEAHDGCGTTTPALGFFSANGSTYFIRKACANPIGSMGPLERLPLNYTNALALTTTTPTVNAGGVASFAIKVTGAGAVQGPTMAVGSAFVSPAGGASYFAQDGPGSPAADAYGPSTDTYEWVNRASPPPGGNTWYYFNFFTSATTPTNTYCFLATDTPYSNNPTPTPNSFSTPPTCITVDNPKIPLLSIASGDVHAGCPTNGNGSATIATNVGSSDVEVVSAAGTISGLSSAVNSVNESLNNYSTVEPLCLPDLWSRATPYLTSGSTLIASGSNVDLSTLAAGVYRVLGNVTIHGVVGASVTLVVTGDVTINGSVTLNPAVEPRSGLPGLGVIANGNINFVPSGAQVDEVDGYYWAAGTISTCLAAPGSCNNTLQVNGALLGYKVALQRYGAAGVFGNTLAENVALTGQLYLNPPPIFGTLNPATTNNADGRGEQTPRY